MTLDVRACIEGESYGKSLSCLPCSPGNYLYDAQVFPGECEVCDVNANCHGKNITSPNYGYWRANATSTNFILCFNEEACLEGDETTPMANCSEGYRGIMCADCDDRYFRNGAF